MDAHGTEPSKPEAVMPKDSPCATSAAAQSWPSEEEIAQLLFDKLSTEMRVIDPEIGDPLRECRYAARAVLAACIKATPPVAHGNHDLQAEAVMPPSPSEIK